MDEIGAQRVAGRFRRDEENALAQGASVSAGVKP
jgi:hypothetical protein